MAKKSAENRNIKREKMVRNGGKIRQALKKLIRKSSDEEERMDACLDLAKRKRDESPSRVRNRCQQCGRPHGVLSSFWFVSYLFTYGCHAR